MKVILGIDPGTHCGWSLWHDGKISSAGTWNLSPRRHEGGGMRYLMLRAYLDEFRASEPDTVAYEEVRRHLGTDAAHIYGGVIATLSAWCEERKIPYMAVPVGTVKKVATGLGNASKEMMLASARKRWPSLFEFCLIDDNAADACWITEAAARELGWVK